MKSRSRGKRKYPVRASQPGVIQGTLVMDPDAVPPIIEVIAYGPDDLVQQQVESPRELVKYLKGWPVVWVNVDGLGDGQVIHQIGQLFNLHQLALEDVAHLHQRAKVEEYGPYTFIVLRMVEYTDQLETEQVTIFLGQNFVVTFQERHNKDCIAAVRERLRKSQGKMRSSGPGYLVYTLIDAVIDGYFPVLEKYSDRIEELEDQVTADSSTDTIARVHELKTDLLTIRRALWPHREAINTLLRDPNPRINDEARIYLRDCYDHTVQLIDLVETHRELASDLRDFHLSSASHRMNEIMKVLTIISTIFIPLTFIAGVYGMNFHTDDSPWNMPELKWYYGYPICLAVMLGVTLVMVAFFRRKGWIGGRWRRRSKTADNRN